MEFLVEHKEVILVGLGVIIGSFIPVAKTHLMGRKVGEKIPKKLAIAIADHLDAFEKGLRQQDVNGDTSIISNEQLSKATEKLKIDVGLEQKSKGKDLK
ncbi:hypothetical protein [uncultured Clostridium sp.]|uniref:hypothetical protein n=1 Tax=uncultured Clostridium sp. TaxID=59620 RepID=UPI00262973EB|nr:hypothetical protein [uncultured Clostridium sp.]